MLIPVGQTRWKPPYKKQEFTAHDICGQVVMMADTPVLRPWEPMRLNLILFYKMNAMG